MSDTIKMTEQQMRETCQRLGDKLRAIEKAKWLKENSDKVGSCWKYLNSYGSGKKWWAYARVKKIAYSLGGSYTTFQFELDCKGGLQTQNQSHTLLGGWIPCSENEYLRAWNRALSAIAKVQP